MSDLSVTINADTTKFIQAVKNSKQELDSFERSNKQLRNTMLKTNDVTEEQVRAFRNSVNSLDKVSSGTRTTKQSIRILNDEIKRLSLQFHNLSDTAKNSKFGDTISNQVRKARTELERLKKVDKDLKNSTISKKGDNKIFKEVGDSIKEFSSIASAFNSGGLVSALGNLAGPLSVVTAAFAGLNEVIRNNETLLDRWQGVTSGAGNAWTNFMRTFNFSTIGASFTAGQNFYNASDALESYRALNAAYLGDILYNLQKAKTDKSEGKPWSNTQLSGLKKDIGNYYDQEIKMIQDVIKAKRNTLLTGLKGDEKRIAESFFTEFDKAANKYVVLEDYKRKYKNAVEIVKGIEEKNAYETYRDPQTGMEYPRLKPGLVEKLEKTNPLYSNSKSLIKGYGFLINSESDLNEYVKLLNDEKKSSQEKERLIKETNEAVASKKEAEKNIQQLYEDLWKKEDTIKKERNKKLSERDTGLLQTSIEEYKDIGEKIYKQFGTFESENAQAFWKEWTKVEHAILENKNIDEAIKEARNNLLKYIIKKGKTVEEFVKELEKEFTDLGEEWPWYSDVTDKYFNSITTDKITRNLGTPEDILKIINENIEEEIKQLKSKYPIKSQSYFKEVSDIYDKYLKYLTNFENKIEIEQKKLDELQEKLKSLVSGDLKKKYDSEKKRLNNILTGKESRYGTLLLLKDEGGPVDDSTVEEAKNDYYFHRNELLSHQQQYNKELKETQEALDIIGVKLALLKNETSPYEELKKNRDSFLQKAGIRPYPAFVFNNYENGSRIKLIEEETNAIINLAGAYNSLFAVISDEDDKVSGYLQSVLTGVQQGAKAFIELSKIQLAASEAVALGKANASAAGLPFPYNLAAMATVTAAVLSTFSSFYQVAKFANGGIVGGSSLGGDQMVARVNSGEMILNGSQQRKLFNLLNGNGGYNTSTSIPEIKVRIAGSDLVGVLDNYGKKLNRVR